MKACFRGNIGFFGCNVCCISLYIYINVVQYIGDRCGYIRISSYSVIARDGYSKYPGFGVQCETFLSQCGTLMLQGFASGV